MPFKASYKKTTLDGIKFKGGTSYKNDYVDKLVLVVLYPRNTKWVM